MSSIYRRGYITVVKDGTKSTCFNSVSGGIVVSGDSSNNEITISAAGKSVGLIKGQVTEVIGKPIEVIMEDALVQISKAMNTPPDVATLTDPGNLDQETGFIELRPAVTLSCDPGENAIGYQYQIATEATFNNVIIGFTGSNEMQIEVPGAVELFWRIRAIGGEYFNSSWVVGTSFTAPLPS